MPGPGRDKRSAYQSAAFIASASVSSLDRELKAARYNIC